MATTRIVGMSIAMSLTARIAFPVAFLLARSNGVSGEMVLAQANTAANASGLVGVCCTILANNTAGLVAALVGFEWIQFDAAPAAGAIAYLSTANAGQAQVAVPAVAGTNQKVRLGSVAAVSGTLGLVSLRAEILPAAADGLA